MGALRRWASGRQMLTSRLRSIIDGNSETTIESLAYMLLDRLFDQASENNETSRRRIPIVPVLDELDRELRLAALAPRSVSLDNPMVLGECISPMYSPGQPTYLRQLPTDQVLQQGIVIELPRDVTLIAHGRTIHALARRGWDLWCGVRSVEGGEEVYLLARTGLDSRLGVPRKRSAIANMPAGWTLYGPVNFTAELERRAGVTFMARERRLVPRLRGGLSLAGHRSYLIGGEPVVELPGLTDSVTLDGNEQQVTGEELPLRELHLDAGVHVIKAGPFLMTFTTIDVREHPAAVPLLGRTPTGAVVEATEPTADLIHGVQLNSAESQRGEVRLSPVVETVVLLGIPGEVGIIEVTRARWADQLGLPRTAVEMLALSTYPGGDRVVAIPSWLAWNSSGGWTIAQWEHAAGPVDDCWLEPEDWHRLVDEIGPEPTIFQFERSPHLSAEEVLAEWQLYKGSAISK